MQPDPDFDGMSGELDDAQLEGDGLGDAPLDTAEYAEDADVNADQGGEGAENYDENVQASGGEEPQDEYAHDDTSGDPEELNFDPQS